MEQRTAQVDRRGKALQSLSQEFENFSPMDMRCVVGLVDLFREVDCSDNPGSSWLGQFVRNVLLGVAWGDLISMEIGPNGTLDILQGFIRGFEAELARSRDFVSRYEAYEHLKEAHAPSGDASAAASSAS